MTPALPFPRRREWFTGILVTALALILAVAGARPHASSWNDGSRLATVESLVERGTLVIDESIYLRVPSARDASAPNPYDASIPALQAGTGDRIFVGGHYYSHKSPVPAVFMAAWYAALRPVGVVAAERPDHFAWWMALGAAGVPYVVAVLGVFLLAGAVGLRGNRRLLLTASFALATTALAYSRQVNDHVVLLALAVWLLFGLTRLVYHPSSSWLLAGLGTLAGLGYAVEMAAGPLLCAAAGLLVVAHCRRVAPAAVFAAAALPWVLLHHVLNYSIGGTLAPAASMPEFFNWPGSIFDAKTMTGTWKHDSLTSLVVYASELLVGRRGFLGNNLAAVLAVPGMVLVSWKRTAERPLVLFAAGWATATWLLYVGNSNNHSGMCCSIRWLVPLLGPAFYVLALLLRDRPEYTADFVWLTLCGLLVAVYAWQQGPWNPRTMPGLRTLQIVAILGWTGIRWRALRRPQPVSAPVPQLAPLRRAA